jgi:Tol biopolymer transport system component
VPELKEVFEVVTKQTEPEVGSWREQKHLQRRRATTRRAGAFIIVAVIAVVGLLVGINLSRVGKSETGDMPSPTPTEAFLRNGYYLLPSDGGSLRSYPVPVRGFWFRFSPDGSRVAFVLPVSGRTATDPSTGGSGQFEGTANEGTHQIFVMDRDGTHIVQLTHGEFDAGSPTWSEDGRWIAYIVGTTPNSQEIAIQRASGQGEPQVLTALAGGRAFYPTWLPDGSAIGFLYVYPNGVRSEIRTVTMAAPEEVRRLPIANAHFPDWSPDGRQITLTSYGPADGDGRVAITDVDGSNQNALTTIDSLWPFWSPDGRIVAFTGYAPDGSGYKEVGTYVYEVATGEVRLVRAGVQAEGWVDAQTLLVSTPGVPNR